MLLSFLIFPLFLRLYLILFFIIGSLSFQKKSAVTTPNQTTTARELYLDLIAKVG